MMCKPLSVLALGLAAALVGCANSDTYSGDVYSASQAKTVRLSRTVLLPPPGR